MANQRRLPLSWYDVLLELNSAPGRRLRMQELGNRVVLSRSRVRLRAIHGALSRIVDAQEEVCRPPAAMSSDRVASLVW
jgi:hypothetical protein